MEHWYVYRCPYGKELALQQNVQTIFGVECFVPTEKVRQRDRHGKFIWVQRSVLTGYIFVHIEQERQQLIPRRLISLRTMVRMSEGLLVPVIVPDREMASFIRVSGNKEEKIAYLDPSKLDFKKGDRVRVIGGSFVGVEGVFMQIGGKHEKRVIIQIEGLIAVATAAIPASLVEMRRVRDLQPYVGRELEAKIIELDKQRNNVVLSRRALEKKVS